MCGRFWMTSGGIDSSSVTALAMRALKDEGRGRPIESFCIQFEDDATHFVPTELRPDVDAPYAVEAASFIGSEHRTVTVSREAVLDAIPITRRARDLPGWGQFDGSTYVLFREMRKHCAVAVTGEIADELFGGYQYFFNPALIQRETFPWLEEGPKLSRFLSPSLTSQVEPEADEVARYHQWISDVPPLPGEDPENARMREIFYLTMSGRLSVLLDRMDRMSMAVGLEMRLPFCDHRLIEYIWNVPWSMKSMAGLKGLLKAAMADALPSSTLNRKKSAYPHIQNRDYDEGLLSEASAIINDKCSPIAEMFDSTRLNGLIEQIRANKAGLNAAHVLIQLVEMRAWVDDYGVSLR
jgi:asparagine synthase (glutamine-hydrolysing)